MNRVILTGRLTRDPEIRWTQGQDQTCMARFTLAVDRRSAKRDGNERTADFVPCYCFGKLAEHIEKYYVKGMKVELEGRIRTGSYTNRDGKKVYTTEVLVESSEFAESRKDAAGSSDGGGKAGSGRSDTEGFMDIPEGAEDGGLPFC